VGRVVVGTALCRDPETRQRFLASLAATRDKVLDRAELREGENWLAVVVDALAYVVETQRPTEHATLLFEGINTVAACTDPPLLLFGTSDNVIAVRASGVAWRTPRLCVDDLQLRRAGRGGVICSCDNSAVYCDSAQTSPTSTLSSSRSASIHPRSPQTSLSVSKSCARRNTHLRWPPLFEGVLAPDGEPIHT
jgi:hypothetical protein